MVTRFTTLTTAELETASQALSDAARWARTVGQYELAARCLALSREANQHVLRREADHRQHIARQLSLCPPGAYSH